MVASLYGANFDAYLVEMCQYYDLRTLLRFISYIEEVADGVLES